MQTAQPVRPFTRRLSSSESSYSQKLIVEHTRYQDLQQRHQRTEEAYEKRLKAAEERRVQSLEELRQAYESRLEEKSQLLAEVVRGEEVPAPTPAGAAP